MKARHLILIVVALAIGACGKSEGPASPEELDNANVIYVGAQDLVKAKLGRIDARFPTITSGISSSDGNGEWFKTDSLKIQQIDADAFVIGHYSLPDGTGAMFGVNMSDNGGMWEPMGENGVTFTPYK